LASRQGFGELKTEQLGGHSQEYQRHRQAPIDDDDNIAFRIFFPRKYMWPIVILLLIYLLTGKDFHFL